MATNKNLERFSTFQLTTPSGVTISSGQPLLFGNPSEPGTLGAIACVAVEEKSGAATTPTFDSAGTQITVDCEGVYNLTVVAASAISPATGDAIAVGDPVFFDGGTFDATSGITYGGTLNANAATGVFFGRALDALASTTTGVIRVILRNAC